MKLLVQGDDYGFSRGIIAGILDAELKELTSFSIGRIQGHRLLTSPLILQRVKENSITLITYYDLIG